jgi:hypothetical protein
MTKLEELAALAETVQRLGPDSYLGPWLAESLPTLRGWVQSDMFPPTAEALALQAAADRQQAADILKAANAEHSAALARCEEMRRQARADGIAEVQAMRSRARAALLAAVD